MTWFDELKELQEFLKFTDSVLIEKTKQFNFAQQLNYGAHWHLKNLPLKQFLKKFLIPEIVFQIVLYLKISFFRDS